MEDALLLLAAPGAQASEPMRATQHALTELHTLLGDPSHPHLRHRAFMLMRHLGSLPPTLFRVIEEEEPSAGGGALKMLLPVSLLVHMGGRDRAHGATQERIYYEYHVHGDYAYLCAFLCGLVHIKAVKSDSCEWLVPRFASPQACTDPQ